MLISGIKSLFLMFTRYLTGRMMNNRRLARLGLVSLLFILTQSLASACPVCFGAEGDPATEGLNFAILTLLGVTGTVVGGFVSFFLRLKRRSRMNAAAMGKT